MRLEDFSFELTQLPGAMPVWHARVDAQQWRAACRQVRDKGGRLVALWGADDTDRGARLCRARGADGAIRAARAHAAARRRALSGHLGHFPGGRTACSAPRTISSASRAENAADDRKWLRHASWPADVFPLRKDRSTRKLAVSDRRPTDTIRSCRSTAKACTRFRWGRCTRARSSRDIFVSRSWAKACCSSRSGSATSTKASRSASSR